MNGSPDKVPAKISVAHILEATTGGTRRHLVDLVTHLNPDRFSISVICSALRDPSFLHDIDLMRKRGIDVFDIPMVRDIRPHRDLLSMLRIRRRLAEINPMIVHTHSSKAGFLGRLAARWLGIHAIVHTPHGFSFQMDVAHSRQALYRRLEKTAARWADRIICVSCPERDAAEKQGIAGAEKLVLIPNGVDADMVDRETLSREDIASQFGISAGRPIVGAIGRLTRQKGYADLIRAAETVVDRIPDVCFLIVGDGRLRPRLQSLAEGLGLGDSVVFAGARDDPQSCYRLFDVFAAPSLWEGLPYTVLDAMTYGVPVVGARVGGIPDVVVHGENGLLVSPHDVPALASAILELLQYPAQRARLGTNATRTILASYTRERMVGDTEALYESLVQSET